MTDPVVLADAPLLPTQLFTSTSLWLTPWPDELLDALGHDPRSWYVERFWLGVLGPSATWLLRRIAASFDEHPDGFELPLADTARELGLGDKGGRHSPFIRALARLCLFEMACGGPNDGLAVRRMVAPLARRQLQRLPDSLRAAHDDWQKVQSGGVAPDQVRRRARQLALSLVELGEDREATERQLIRWRFHPAVVGDALSWAWQRHADALDAAQSDAT